MSAVTVIIPAYRVTEYIAGAIESVLAQTFQDFSLIIVNDGCPDTQSLERLLEPYFSRITYIKQPNRGVSAARNAGIKAATSEFVAFLDGDDMWTSRYLESQMEYLNHFPEIAVFFPNGTHVGETPRYGEQLLPWRELQHPVNFCTVASIKRTVLIAATCRRSALLSVGGFDESLHHSEDFDLWLRMMKAGHQIGFNINHLFLYRHRSESATSSHAVMAQAAIHVLQNISRFGLSRAEKRAVKAGKRAILSDFHYCQGSESLKRWDLRTARRSFAKLAICEPRLKNFLRLALCVAAPSRLDSGYNP